MQYRKVEGQFTYITQPPNLSVESLSTIITVIFDSIVITATIMLYKFLSPTRNMQNKLRIWCSDLLQSSFLAVLRADGKARSFSKMQNARHHFTRNLGAPHKNLWDHQERGQGPEVPTLYPMVV